jgi:hypothetical protein
VLVRRRARSAHGGLARPAHRRPRLRCVLRSARGWAAGGCQSARAGLRSTHADRGRGRRAAAAPGARRHLLREVGGRVARARACGSSGAPGLLGDEVVGTAPAACTAPARCSAGDAALAAAQRTARAAAQVICGNRLGS